MIPLLQTKTADTAHTGIFASVTRPSPQFYGTDRNGTEQFRHIIVRNGTGSNAHTTAKYIAIKLPTVVLAFPVSKGLYIY